MFNPGLRVRAIFAKSFNGKFKALGNCFNGRNHQNNNKNNNDAQGNEGWFHPEILFLQFHDLLDGDFRGFFKIS